MDALEALQAFGIGVVGSLVASVVFWLLTFKISRTDVIFSKVLEKSSSAKKRSLPRYRIRIANFGRRDLLEVSVKAKIIVKASKKNYTYLEVGNGGYIPVLARRRGKRIKTSILTIYPGKMLDGEFQKLFYAAHIRQKAADRTLTIEDIFDTYKDKVTIILYVFGNDSLTGARRTFVKEYTEADVQDGVFKKITFRKRKNRAAAIDMISQIVPPHAEPGQKAEADSEADENEADEREVTAPETPDHLPEKTDGTDESL